MKIGKKRIYSGCTVKSGCGSTLISGDVVVTVCDDDPFVSVRLNGESYVFCVPKRNLKKYKKNKDVEPEPTPVTPKGKYKIIDVSDYLDRSRLFIHYEIESEELSEFVCECKSIGGANVIVAALEAFNDAVFFGGGE